MLLEIITFLHWNKKMICNTNCIKSVISVLIRLLLFSSRLSDRPPLWCVKTSTSRRGRRRRTPSSSRRVERNTGRRTQSSRSTSPSSPRSAPRDGRWDRQAGRQISDLSDGAVCYCVSGVCISGFAAGKSRWGQTPRCEAHLRRRHDDR